MMTTHTPPKAHSCSCESGCSSTPQTSGLKRYLPAISSFVMLAAGILSDHLMPGIFVHKYIRLAWYIVAYIPVGLPVLKEAWEAILQKDFFNEFSLMGIATIGAFLIGEYPEGVAVMLFYSVGELFQESAVNKARNNIKALLDIRPETATVLRNGQYTVISPEQAGIGEQIMVKAGEKVPLDGALISDAGSFNTSALTGESKPKTIRKNEPVLAGMLNLDKVVEIKVEKKYEDSSLSKILEMVQDATSRKAKTELLIRKFAKIYTPIVFFLALAIALVPYLFVADYVFSTWLYRALIFLVISCPCALVISIPLGYFGGIGAASRNGILFKGANYLDLMASLDTVVMDKTGTLTKGVFNVQEIVSSSYDKQKLLALAAALERQSNHPIAKAIVAASAGNQLDYTVENTTEIAGRGIKGTINGDEVVAGNARLMQESNIPYDSNIDTIVETVVIIAINGRYEGYITISDEIKEDALSAINEMRKQGIKRTVMLSGDNPVITNKIAESIGIDEAYGGLLPEGKVKHLETIKANSDSIVAFVGDGINDAPVLALSDIGIAMGGIGSDAAIEIADVVIQTDQPSKIATAIKIARTTKQIVVQNIVLAISVKVIVMLLGALGYASMWGAVFADVGVALLAILNAVRILRMRF